MKKLFVYAALLIGAASIAPARETIRLYEIPAISSVRRMPDQVAPDAKSATALRFIATPGEFEPASFLVEAREKIEKLEIKWGAFKGPKGAEIPADALDIRIVKVWYQAGTAWYSYFGDPSRRAPVPELLLHDDAMVRVDREKQENYLRVGDDYRWISYPFDKAEGVFNYLTEPVADAATLQPVSIPKGENRQFWATMKIPDGAGEGIYRGTLHFTVEGKAAGSLDVQVRVLPFRLPDPMTYYNLENPYLVSIYATDVLDASRRRNLDREKAETLQKAIYRNLLDHNVRNIKAHLDISGRKDRDQALAEVRRELELMKEVGAPMKPLIAAGWVFDAPGDAKKEDRFERFQSRLDTYIKAVKEEVGHDDIYLSTWDEAGEGRIKIFRDLAEYVENQNMKVWMTTAEGRHFDLAGYAIDLANHGGWPEREKAARWHAIGSKITSYAGPHLGVENPDVFRRWEGLARYKENYDGSFNYKYFDQLHPTISERLKQNVWNDFLGSQFRSFCMVYPTANGMIDTLAWEGFREGIDDVRYATLLKQEAKKAIEGGSPEARREAKKALMWLELLDAHNSDLNTARQEMIAYILKLQKLTKS